jgi:hypothetical protein
MFLVVLGLNLLMQGDRSPERLALHGLGRSG